MCSEQMVNPSEHPLRQSVRSPVAQLRLAGLYPCGTLAHRFAWLAIALPQVAHIWPAKLGSSILFYPCVAFALKRAMRSKVEPGCLPAVLKALA